MSESFAFLHFNTLYFFLFFIPCPLSQFVTQGDSLIVAKYAINIYRSRGGGGSGREERVKLNSIKNHNFVSKGNETVGLLLAI